MELNDSWMDRSQDFGPCKGELDNHRFRFRCTFSTGVILGASCILFSGPLAILRTTPPKYFPQETLELKLLALKELVPY